MTSEDRDDFLRRWSRRKREAAAKETPAPAAGQAPAQADPAPKSADANRTGAPVAPPPVEALTPESDFRAFMDAKIDSRTRNAALKKLFVDPRFNVIDPLDIDIDDYSKLERLPEAAVKTLAHARNALLAPGEARAGEDRGEAQEPQEPPRPAAGDNAVDPAAGEPGAAQAQDRDGAEG
jgi:hypothetical protein